MVGTRPFNSSGLAGSDLLRRCIYCFKDACQILPLLDEVLVQNGARCFSAGLSIDANLNCQMSGQEHLIGGSRCLAVMIQRRNAKRAMSLRRKCEGGARCGRVAQRRYWDGSCCCSSRCSFTSCSAMYSCPGGTDHCQLIYRLPRPIATQGGRRDEDNSSDR